MALALQDRASAYLRAFPQCADAVWVAGGGRWLYGVWQIGQDYRNASRYYGAYPHGFLRRVEALFPDLPRTWPRPVLHAFSGSVPQGNYWRVDVNPTTGAEYVGSVYDIAKLTRRRFNLVIADPPYTPEDAKKYGTPSVNRSKAMEGLAKVTKPGGHLVSEAERAVQNDVSSGDSRQNLSTEAVVGVSAARRRQEDWQPIDTAPKDGTHILLWTPSVRVVGRWDDEAYEPGEWRCIPKGYGIEPTHWMPLPDPPCVVPPLRKENEEVERIEDIPVRDLEAKLVRPSAATKTEAGAGSRSLARSKKEEPYPERDPQWLCSGCANWWPANKRSCSLCGATVHSAKVIRGHCEKF